MLRKSLMVDHIYLSLLPSDRHRCKWIALLVILQCFLVYAGAVSIIYCYWSPQRAYFEYDKLIRIMYLFDYESCGYALDTARSISNLKLLPNDTMDFTGVRPIAWKPADVTVSTRLSAKTRNKLTLAVYICNDQYLAPVRCATAFSVALYRSMSVQVEAHSGQDNKCDMVLGQTPHEQALLYIELSLIVHVIWMFIAILLHLITRSSTNVKLLKCMLLIFLMANIFVIFFDISMAIVYVAHIQQSLSKGMVLRYSGWSVDFQVSDPDEFAGWLPLSASVLWLRGIILLFWNIFCCKLIYNMRCKIKRREVRRKLRQRTNLPIPEPDSMTGKDKSVLYYRTGEHNPDICLLRPNHHLQNLRL